MNKFSDEGKPLFNVKESLKLSYDGKISLYTYIIIKIIKFKTIERKVLTLFYGKSMKIF